MSAPTLVPLADVVGWLRKRPAMMLASGNRSQAMIAATGAIEIMADALADGCPWRPSGDGTPAEYPMPGALATSFEPTRAAFDVLTERENSRPAPEAPNDPTPAPPPPRHGARADVPAHGHARGGRGDRWGAAMNHEAMDDRASIVAWLRICATWARDPTERVMYETLARDIEAKADRRFDRVVR